MARTETSVAANGTDVKVAWATAPSGLSTVIVAGPSQIEELMLDTKSDINEIKIKLKGSSDIYVVHNTIVPGGHTGWHSHPGPSLILARFNLEWLSDGQDSLGKAD